MRVQPHLRFNGRKAILFILAILLIIWGFCHFTATGTRLKSAWNKVIYTSNNQVAVAVYSPKTRKIYTSTNVPNHKFHMASTVKVSILAGLFVKQNGSLTNKQKKLAKKMIESSDNYATNKLYKALGEKEGLQETFDRFGMTQSTAKQSWGLSTTTAKDQVKLLNNIFYSSRILNDSAQKYIASLMSNVEKDQIWGVSTSSDKFALKNGWLEHSKDKWIINSIGYVENDNKTSYTIAIYSDKNTSMQTGEEVLNQIARVTKPVMD